MKTYRFWAIFSYQADGITVTFPDLSGCITCGWTTEEAKKMAKEALVLYLDEMPIREIPLVTRQNKPDLETFEKAYEIEAVI